MKGVTREFELDGEALRLERRDQEDGHFALRQAAPEEELSEAPAIEGEALRGDSGWITLRMRGATRRVRMVRQGDDLHVSVEGESYCFRPSRRGRGAHSGAGTGRVESPMPGTVLEVLVSEGQAVEADQDLLVVEAMKMEHRMKAALPGTVRGLGVKAGDQVGAGQVLLEVVPAAEGAPQD